MSAHLLFYQDLNANACWVNGSIARQLLQNTCTEKIISCNTDYYGHISHDIMHCTKLTHKSMKDGKIQLISKYFQAIILHWHIALMDVTNFHSTLICSRGKNRFSKIIWIIFWHSHTTSKYGLLYDNLHLKEVL